MTKKYRLSNPVLIEVPIPEVARCETRKLMKLIKAVRRDMKPSAERDALLEMLEKQRARPDRSKALEIREIAKKQIGLSENEADRWTARVYGMTPRHVRRMR